MTGRMKSSVHELRRIHGCGERFVICAESVFLKQHISDATYSGNILAIAILLACLHVFCAFTTVDSGHTCKDSLIDRIHDVYDGIRGNHDQAASVPPSPYAGYRRSNSTDLEEFKKTDTKSSLQEHFSV